MTLLSAADILAVRDGASETVPVPEWGGDVIIKAMTGTERDAFEAGMWVSGQLDRRNYRSKLLVQVLVNENGTRIFTDAQAADLGKRSAAVIDRLYDVAARLSGLSDAEQEEMEGNSETDEPADGADSSSPSPATSAA